MDCLQKHCFRFTTPCSVAQCLETHASAQLQAVDNTQQPAKSRVPVSHREAYNQDKQTRSTPTHTHKKKTRSTRRQTARAATTQQKTKTAHAQHQKHDKDNTRMQKTILPHRGTIKHKKQRKQNNTQNKKTCKKHAKKRKARMQNKRNQKRNAKKTQNQNAKKNTTRKRAQKKHKTATQKKHKQNAIIIIWNMYSLWHRCSYNPSSCLIFVLYCESWVREEAGES